MKLKMLLSCVFLMACDDSSSPPNTALPPATIADCEQTGCTVTETLTTSTLNISDQPIILSGGGSIILE